LLAYWTVLVAELVGDKSVYTVASLAIRFRPVIVLSVLAVAFAGKMLVVVLMGKAMVQLHSRWIDIMSAAAFLISAMMIWFEEPEKEWLAKHHILNSPRAAAICFASLFFTEWGDAGQISAAALTLKSGAVLAVWVGGTLAMLTKGVVAMTIGRRLYGLLPQPLIGTVASISCGLLGVIALGAAVFR